MKDSLIQGLPYLLIAAILDLLQMAIEAIFGFIGALSGTLGGVAAGAVVGSKICSIVPHDLFGSCVGVFMALGGFFGSYLDPALAPIVTPIALIMGTIVNIAITLSIGTGFVVLLFAVSRMFDGGIVMPFYLAKIIPISDVAPLWSVMVGRLILKKTLKKVAPAMIKGAVVGAVRSIEGGPEAMAAGAALGAARAGAKEFVQENKQKITPVQVAEGWSYHPQQSSTIQHGTQRGIDGIKPKHIESNHNPHLAEE